MKGKDCAQLLWAYTLNRPLSKYSVEMMKAIILWDKENLDCWDLSIIMWGFSKFEALECEEIYFGLIERCI